MTSAALLVCIMAVAGVPVVEVAEVQLAAQQGDAVLLAPRVLAHEDAREALTLEAAQQQMGGPAWGPLAEVAVTPFSRSAFFLAARVRGGGRPEQLVLEMVYPLIDQVDLVVTSSNGDRRVQRGGTAMPSISPELSHEHPAFLVDVGAHEDVTLMWRVHNRGAMVLDARLWSRTAFERYQHDRMLLLGLLYGLLVAAIVYSMALWVLVRDSSYARFVAFLGSVTLLALILDGLAQPLLWPQSHWWAIQSRPVMVSFAALLALRFGDQFLSIGVHAPRHHAWSRRMEALNVATMALCLVLPYLHALSLAVVVMLVSLAVGALAGARCIQLGVPYAGTLMTGVGVLAASIAATGAGPLLHPFVALPAQHALRGGACVLALVFSTALGRRLRLVEEARMRAQEAALAAESRARENVERLNAELEDRVQGRTRELVALNQRKDDLVASVSHDFRTPLAVIRQNLQTIARDLPDISHEDLKMLVDGAARQETRLSRMCAGLLDLARLKDRGILRQAVDAENVMRAVVEGLRPAADEHGVALHWKLIPPLDDVQGDADRLEQALQNLVDNALKFTPAGGSVTVTALAGDGGGVSFHVEDTGPGIPPDALAHLFEPFYQVPGAQAARPGSGLGLAIVRAVATAHGGQVQVHSRTGGGTIFELNIPAG